MTAGAKAVQIASRYVGSHDGTPFLHYMGIYFHAAWCLCLCQFAWGHAVAPKRNPLIHTARCSTEFHDALARPWAFAVLTSDDLQWGRKVPVGAVAIFKHGSATDGSDWSGHAELFVSELDRTRFRTIGGNTTCPGEHGSERMGNCVARKIRRAGIRGFRLMGFISPRGID